MPNTDPYYLFIGPAWRAGSNGLDVFHRLCSQLNDRGYDAYLQRYVTHPYGHHMVQCPWLNTKLAPEGILSSDRPCITVYPEGYPTVLRGHVIVRWLLYYAQPHLYQDGDIFFTWANKYGPGVTLNTHWSDESIWYDEGLKRDGFCWYAHKHTALHGGELPDELKHGVNLSCLRKGDKSTLAYWFKRCKYLWMPEDSALDIEAALCGCPTVRAFGESLVVARRRMKQRVEDYRANLATIDEQIDRFIDITQNAKRADAIYVNRLPY